jgi:universal stress protein E
VHTHAPVPRFEGAGESLISTTHARNYGRKTRKQLERLAAPLRRKGIKVATAVVEDMPPHEALVRQVRQLEADLVMMQLHRHPRWARWFVTYTDWELVRQCPCPVWIVKVAHSRAFRHVVAAVDPLHPHARAGKLDDRILETAGQLAKSLGGPVTLCHVADVPFTYEPGGVFGEPVPVPTPPGVQQRYLQGVAAKVDALSRRHGLSESQRKIQPGLPADLLPRMVEQLRADVLVMGAVSRSGIDRLFLGSMAERIIDRVQCDVLVVKPRAFRSCVPKRRRTSPAVIP